MKKIIVGIIVLAVVVWGGVKLFETKEEKTKEPIKIGAALSLTGKAAYYGEQTKNGLELAIEKIKEENYPFELELIYEDTQSDATPAVSAINKLIDIDKVKLIIGPIRSSDVLAAAPIAEKNRVVLFITVASTDEITQAGDYIFRNRETSAPHGKRMAEFLINKGIRRVAVFSSKSPNSIGYRKFFMDNFKQLGGQIVLFAEYDEKNNDFRTDISKVKNSGAEAFYVVPTFGKDGGLMTKQIRELGYKQLITTTPVPESTEFLDTSGIYSEGVVFTSPAFDIDDPDIQDYRTSYKMAYGKESDFISANAYDAMNIIADAVKTCKGDDSECIKNYLYKVKDYPGVGGLTSFDQNGDVAKLVIIKTVKNGQFVKYEE